MDKLVVGGQGQGRGKKPMGLEQECKGGKKAGLVICKADMKYEH